MLSKQKAEPHVNGLLGTVGGTGSGRNAVKAGRVPTYRRVGKGETQSSEEMNKKAPQ